eukprot:1179316-Prorocentrum_minimum.AAC.3
MPPAAWGGEGPGQGTLAPPAGAAAAPPPAPAFRPATARGARGGQCILINTQGTLTLSQGALALAPRAHLAGLGVRPQLGLQARRHGGGGGWVQAWPHEAQHFRQGRGG